MGSALELPHADLSYHHFTTKFAHVLNQARQLSVFVLAHTGRSLSHTPIQLMPLGRKLPSLQK